VGRIATISRTISDHFDHHFRDRRRPFLTTESTRYPVYQHGKHSRRDTTISDIIVVKQKRKKEHIMSIKSIALAAAAVAALGSTASAESYFELNENLDSGTVLDLGLVRADADGVVEIYKTDAGEPGVLIGTEAVHFGANSNVRVNVGIQPIQDVIAVLKIDGQVVAQQDYNIAR